MLTKPDSTTVTTTVDGDGNWSFVPNPLDNGETGSVTATDPSGNTSDPTTTGVTDKTVPDAPVIDAVIDDVAPIEGNVSNNGHTNDQTPTLQGTAEANSLVIIYSKTDSGLVKLGEVTANADGQWEFTTSALGDGNYAFIAKVKDDAGNESVESNEFSVNIDTSQPADNTITIDSISDDTGALDDDFITNDNTLIFHGSLGTQLKANEKVEISLDGGKTWISVTVNGTEWTYDHSAIELVDGSYDVIARIATLAGNEGASANQTVVIDSVGTDAQGLGISVEISTDTSHGLDAGDGNSHSSTATNNDLITRDQTLTLSGNLSAELAAGDSLQISNDGGKTWTSLALTGTSWQYAIPEFEGNGSVTYHFRVVDMAGNVATNTTFKDEGYTVVVDVTNPDALTKAPIMPDSVDTNTLYEFSSETYGKVGAGELVSLVNDVDRDGIYREGLDKIIGYVKADENGDWNLSVRLPAGSSNLGFVVWDEAGNRSGMSTSTSVGATDGTGYVTAEQTWGQSSEGFYGINVASVTLQNGQWVFYQSPPRNADGGRGYNNGSLYFMKDTVNGDADYNYLYLPDGVQEGGYGGFLSGATMFDVNRDGLIDVIGAKSGYGAPYKTSAWFQNADGTFTANHIDTPNGVYQHLGGTIAIDLKGDGYVDIFMSTSETSGAGTNHIFTLLENNGGTLQLNNTVPTGADGRLTMLHELSGVDINNDGTVDIVGHSNRTNTGGYSNLGTSLTVITNDGKTLSGVTHYDNVFQNNGYEDNGDEVANMVWADFNGDGFLDLFIGKGQGKNGANRDNESRIYLNDGKGGLLTSTDDTLWFGDNINAAPSLAIDWNHDGKMDIIEIPKYRASGSPTLYLNTGDNVWNSADQKHIIAPAGQYAGAMAVDYNWDGNVDLLLYTKGKTVLVENTNAVADGTSLNVSIVDGNGINIFFGNTVNLYNSKGELVATQVINAQSSGTTISSGLLNFYGLDPNETYSLQLLRITDGVANHVGGGGNLGGYNETTVNNAWTNIKTGQANTNLVLTAEADDAANNALGNGISGTGYNDTFFATEGDDIYSGGGGWNSSLTGEKVWSATEGLDIVDYSNATQGITADLTAGTATGMGNDKLISIEGLIGSDYDDVFTNSSANNVFEGKGGNDTFYLTHAGNDILLYRLLDQADATGGNGQNTVHGFHVGNTITDKDADAINISELLDYDGIVSFYTDEGEMKLDYNSKGILDYLKVEVVDGSTIVSIDRDGKGGEHDFATVITLENTETDLLTLLANNQIII